jgi:DNA ligase 1
VRLAELVATSEAVAAVSGRRKKIEAIADLLRRADRGEVPIAVAFLSGDLRQRQIGVGYAALRDLLAADTPAAAVRTAEAGGAGDTGAAGGPGGADADGAPGSTRTGQGAAGSPTLTDVDAVFGEIGAATGRGSQGERRRLLGTLFGRATPAERAFLARLLSGELRQGALEGVMIEAVAAAAGVPAEEVRRAHMLGGSLQAVAAAALAAPSARLSSDGGAVPSARLSPDGEAGALAALRSFRLEVGRPLRPMLAAAADSITAAFEKVGEGRPAAVEWKLDGIRIQVHKRGGEVAVFTRTLDDITARVPEVAAAVRALPADLLVLDGEAIALDPDQRPRPFQVTAGRIGSRTDVARLAAEVPLTVFFFDLLHLGGTDLVDEPGERRHARLADAVPAELLIPRTVTASAAEAGKLFTGAVRHGHEGVVVKSLDAPYAAGRRGAGWIKVKPRHTLDLVVLAVEWGHGRRRGWLSNLHLGARDEETGGFVMLGKTFKGLTDELLTWQTGRLLELADPAVSRSADRETAPWGVVTVRPELVVEIAFDGLQVSPRYPGGLALRFARVIRYRPDKRAADADTITAVRAIAEASGVG